MSRLYIFAQEPQPCLSINKRSTAYFISHKAPRCLFTPSGKLSDLRKSWTEWSTYLHAHTHTAAPHSHPPLKKKSDVCVFQKGHVGETQHASSLVSFSQSRRYSGGRGQRRPAGQFTALLWEFHMIQVWEWRVGKAWSGELTLAVLSWLSDKTVCAALKLYTRVFSKKHFSSFSRSGFW